MDTLVSAYPLRYNSTEFFGGLANSRRSALQTVKILAEGALMQAPPIDSNEKKSLAMVGGIGGSDFQKQAQAAMRDVRITLLTMLESGGSQIIKSRDVQKLFGIDASLSWQVFKLFKAKDLLSVAQFIPSAASMQKIFGAARGRGIAEPLIAEAGKSFDCFEALVAKHAGERSRFESMTAGLCQGEDVSQAAEQHRKVMFKAQSFYWGVELGTMYSCNIVAPSSSNAGNCDMVQITNILNFHRLRPDADTHVIGYGYTHSNKETPPQPALEPDSVLQHGAAVLPQFSTNPLPHLRTVTDDSGRSRIVLESDAVGLTSSVDLAFASLFKSIGNVGDSANEFNYVVSVITIRPTERLYMEVLMHRSICQKLQGAVKVYGHVSVGASPDDLRNPAWQLPSFESVTAERSVDDSRLIGVSRRRDLLAYCCDKMGWNIEEFDVYRIQVEYPLMDTNTVVTLAAAK